MPSIIIEGGVDALVFTCMGSDVQVLMRGMVRLGSWAGRNLWCAVEGGGAWVLGELVHEGLAVAWCILMLGKGNLGLGFPGL